MPSRSRNDGDSTSGDSINGALAAFLPEFERIRPRLPTLEETADVAHLRANLPGLVPDPRHLVACLGYQLRAVAALDDVATADGVVSYPDAPEYAHARGLALYHGLADILLGRPGDDDLVCALSLMLALPRRVLRRAHPTEVRWALDNHPHLEPALAHLRHWLWTLD